MKYIKTYENRNDSLVYSVNEKELEEHGYVPDIDYAKFTKVVIENGKSIYCFPKYGKRIQIDDWYEHTKNIIDFCLIEINNEENFKRGDNLKSSDYLKIRYNANTGEITTEVALLKKLNMNMMDMLSNEDYYEDSGWYIIVFTKKMFTAIVNELIFLTKGEFKNSPNYKKWELKNKKEKYNL